MTKNFSDTQREAICPVSPPRSRHWPTVGWACPNICFWRLPSHVHPSANFQTAFLVRTLGPCHRQSTWPVMQEEQQVEMMNHTNTRSLCGALCGYDQRVLWKDDTSTCLGSFFLFFAYLTIHEVGWHFQGRVARKDKVSVKPRAQDTHISYTVEVMPAYDRRYKNSLFFVKLLSGGQAPKLIKYK